MMPQEMAATNPMMREACTVKLRFWTDKVAALLAAAKEKHAPVSDFGPVAVSRLRSDLSRSI